MKNLQVWLEIDHFFQPFVVIVREHIHSHGTVK
jgi:hypothetical protein